MASHAAAGRACELLKQLRGQWLTRTELADELGIEGSTCLWWLREFRDNGIVISRDRAVWHGRGRRPKEFTLAPEWVNDKPTG